MNIVIAVLLAACSAGVTAAEPPAPTAERVAMTQGLEARQRVVGDRQALQHAENRRRCESALRAAAACGKVAGTFYCDARGFRPITPEAGTAATRMGNEARYAMEHCVREFVKRDTLQAPIR